MAAHPSMENLTVIEPGKSDRRYWVEIWQYRELFQVLAWRDLSIRYKQTAIGAIWAIVRPFLTMLIFTIVFGKVAKLAPDGSTPYALMVFAGMLPWTFFATGLADASNSLINNANLIGKVYFPRLIVPTATLIVSLVDFFVSFFLLVGMFVWYRFVPGWQIVFLPFFAALAFFASLGPSLWITALNVRYRDFRYVIPFMVQFGLYVSPVGFSSSVIPEQWRLLYALNPLVGVIDGFRWSLLNGQSRLDVMSLTISVAVTSVCLWFGFSQFRKMERGFADLL
jgi:lipopolysaccharide transport system permease protein